MLISKILLVITKMSNYGPMFHHKSTINRLLFLPLLRKLVVSLKVTITRPTISSNFHKLLKAKRYAKEP